MPGLKKDGLCPACQKGKLLQEVRESLIFEYKSCAKEFQNERVFRCDLCGFEALTQQANKRIEKELTDFRRSIDGLLSGSQLKSIREGLELNIKQMAQLLSVDAKTVGRYENNKITQSQQIDRLYRIFEVFPSVVTYVKEFSSSSLLAQPISRSGIAIFSSSSGLMSVKAHSGVTTYETYIAKTTNEVSEIAQGTWATVEA